MIPPTYPLRPINGGKLNLAIDHVNVTDFFWEPKISGMRLTVHVPTGGIWNRQGEPVAHPVWFKKAIETIQELLPDEEWLDCEGLYQAHDVGRGTVIVLDSMVDEPIEARRQRFAHLKEMPISNDIPTNEVFRIPRFEAGARFSVMALWNTLKGLSREWQAAKGGTVTLYEGVVAKRRASPYPFQLMDAKRENSAWVKHRFI